MGVNFLNAGEVKDAIAYFGKALERDPATSTPTTGARSPRSGSDKTAEAKADLQKVIELQPEGEMAAMAKKALGQLE